MKYQNFAFLKSCAYCQGSGIWNDTRCSECHATGIAGIDFLCDFDSIKIGEGLLYELLHFNSISNNGEKWFAFVDWTQLYGIDLLKLIDDGWIKQHSDAPPVYGNYRDDFPETLYTISFKGRVVIRQPGRFICDSEVV